MAYSTPFKKWDRRRSRQNESPTPESSDKKMKVVDEDELFYDTGSEMSDLKIGDLSEDELLMEAYNTFSNSNNNIPANRLKKVDAIKKVSSNSHQQLFKTYHHVECQTDFVESEMDIDARAEGVSVQHKEVQVCIRNASCWNCFNRGHGYMKCPFPLRDDFCQKCGKPNTKTQEHPHRSRFDSVE